MPTRPSAINAALLQLLREARKREGLTMEALAERAQLDRTYVGRLEKEERQPTVVAAVALADAMGLSLSDLLLRAERIVAGDPDLESDPAVEVVPAAPPRLADRTCVESDAALRFCTGGLSAETLCAAIDDTYHTLDLLDRQLQESGVQPFARLVELANLSSMIGNIVGGAIARHSGGLYERSGPNKYQDLRATSDGEHVEIKTALESNRPKGHLSKAGYYLTFRYVLAGTDGSYLRGKDTRGEVVYIWEVRFGFLEKEDFDESNTPGDSGKTAVVKNEILKNMERIYFCPDYFPYANLNGPWGTDIKVVTRKPFGA